MRVVGCISPAPALSNENLLFVTVLLLGIGALAMRLRTR
jgi:hypothetical protein